MKPTSQISHSQHASRRFPLTDYAFKATADAKSSSSAVLRARKAPAFHRLSSEFFGAEATRDYFAEFSMFMLITGISVWPIISALVAVTRLVRNY
jgi:hypothetical protein